MRRRLSNLAAAASLLLLLATIVLWVRGYWIGFGAHHATPTSHQWLFVARG